MLKAAFELDDSALARPEEAVEIGEQRCERRAQQSMLTQLAVEVATAAKARAGMKSLQRLRRTSGEGIEHSQRLATETMREAGARQAQHRPDGAHSHARQARDRL